MMTSEAVHLAVGNLHYMLQKGGKTALRCLGVNTDSLRTLSHFKVRIASAGITTCIAIACACGTYFHKEELDGESWWQND